MTRTLGVFPNAAVVTCLPQSDVIPAFGVLRVQHGTEIVDFPDMKVDWATIRHSTEGHQLMIRLLDRRWRWKFTLISGRYNVHLSDGTIDPSTAKTPQELATLCLNAMGETSFDVSQLPNKGGPEVDWIYANAAFVLHQLCEDRGCDISLNLDNTVSIVRLGEGLLLPDNDDLMTPSITADPPEGPDKVVVICGETEFESRLRLKAIGRDLDGTIKPIDDLSYKPPGGWQIADFKSFNDINKENIPSLTDDTAEKARRLARSTVLKWFIVESQADGTLNVPGYGAVNDISQILPLNTYLLNTQTAAAGDTQVNQKCRVFGIYVKGESPETFQNTQDALAEWEGDFTVDRQQGIVKLDEVAYRLDDDSKTLPAKLYLQTSYGVRESDDGRQVRHVVERNITGAGAGVLLQEAARIEEIALSYQAEYSPGNPESVIEPVKSNQEKLDEETADILDAMQLRWTAGVYGYGMYRGVKNYSTDGAIRQVAWYVNDNGARTMLSRNSETAVGTVRMLERRRRRLLELQTQDAPMLNSHSRKGQQQGLFRGKGYA